MSESLCGEHTIVLDRSRNARAFNLKGESFWCGELARIIGKVGEHLESIRPADRRAPGDDREQTAGDADQRPYLSIAIFGPSGSGKSSLLKTLVREVNLGDPDKLLDELRNRPRPRARGEVKGGAYALPVMYPDRFARHDHFLYAFLANALKEEKEVRDHRRKRRQDRHGRDRDRDREPAALSPVQQSFQELSEFLRVIDEPEKGQDFDPLGLSLERLERHTSGLLLREKIGTFIDRLADGLTGSKDDSLVLLTVDDADMSPEHLVATLQSFQSYLLHPRLVPVFTFTDRTAEEMLRVHFRKHLGGDSGKQSSASATVYEQPGEGTQRLSVETQLALQYLSRCFPVRNRIRLGPAPARLRAGKYESLDATEGQEVLGLLTRSSRLLFGCPDRDAAHDIRVLLRPSTLRRQLHVVDEMVEAGVADLYQEKDDQVVEKNEPCDNPDELRWVNVFNRAAWSLMNVHRDVLREFDLHLEDLYSWSPQGLQRVILDILLNQDMEARRALLRRWRRRTDSRRGQTVSLLAANVFRPWLPGDEPSGDQGYLPRYTPEQLAGRPSSGGRGPYFPKGVPEGREGLAAPTALIWFLRLVIGFYNPQLLAWSRPTDVAREQPEKGRVVGVGWDLTNGPVNAIRAAATDEAVASSGMIFLEPRTFADALREESWLERWGAFCDVLSHEAVEMSDEAAAEARAKKIENIGTLEKKVGRIRMAREWEDRDPRGKEKRAIKMTRRFYRSLGYARLQEEKMNDFAKEALKLHGQRPGLSFAEALELLELSRLASDEKCLEQKKPEDECNNLPDWIEDIADQDDPHRFVFDKLRELLECDAPSRNQTSVVSQNVFLLRCWSYYGYDRSRYWSAVSFWRGLGLIGRLLEARRREQLEDERRSASGSASDDDAKERESAWKETVQGILRTHLIRGMVPAEFLGEEAGAEGLNLAFERWDLARKQLDLDDEETVGGQIFRWLNRLGRVEQDGDHEENSGEKRPVLPISYREDCSEAFRIPMHRSDDACRWSRSLLRRLHGDDIVGNLLPQLNAAYLEDQGRYVPGAVNSTGYRWNAGVAMTTWTRLLLDFWRGVLPIQELLRTCPLLAPFTDGPLVEDLRGEALKRSYLELVDEGVGWKAESSSVGSRLEDLEKASAEGEEGAELLRFAGKIGLPRKKHDGELTSLSQLEEPEQKRLLEVIRRQAHYADRYAAAVHLFHQIPRAHRRHSSKG